MENIKVTVLAFCLSSAMAMDFVPWRPDLIISRFKRQNFGGGPSATNCVAACYQQMEIKMKTVLPSSFTNFSKDNADPSSIAGQFSPSMLEKMCFEVYRPTYQCSRGCPKDAIGDMILKSTVVLDYLCVTNYDDVKHSMPCLTQSVNETKDNLCKSEYDEFLRVKSENDKIQAEAITNIKAGSGSFSMNDQINLLDNQCKSMVGIVKCTLNAVSKKCDQTAVDVVKNLYSKSIDTIDAILQVVGSDQNPPSHCREVKDLTKGAYMAAPSALILLLVLVFSLILKN